MRHITTTIFFLFCATLLADVNIRNGALELSSIVATTDTVTIEVLSNLDLLDKSEIEIIKVLPGKLPDGKYPRYDQELTFQLKKIKGPGRAVSSKQTLYPFSWTTIELGLKASTTIKVMNPVVISLDAGAKIPPVLAPDLPPSSK